MTATEDARSGREDPGLVDVWIESAFEPAGPEVLSRAYVSILAAHAARAPGRPAFLGSGPPVTWADFLARIETLAGVIAAAPAPPGPVALLAGLSADYMAGLFACLEAGRPVVILEPAQPVLRQAGILETAGAALVLHDAGREPDPRLLEGRAALTLTGHRSSPAPAGMRLEPHAPALLFTTSGSTGAPKLVAHSQRSLRTKLWALSRREGTSSEDRFMILGSHANFGSMLCLLTNLLAGATVCVTDIQAEGLAAAFARMGRFEVNSVWMAPSVFRMAVRATGAAEALAHVRLIKLGGEPCTLSDLRQARAATPPGCMLLNSYGTTEGGAFTWLTTDRVLPEFDVVPVGTVDPDYAYALLDESGAPVAEEEAGEITVSSAGVALGYWTRGAIDAARFPADPVKAGHRIYRLGDLGRRRPDGELVMLGRLDRVIKINGQSVSPVEVEAALQALPGCAACAVLAYGPAEAQRLAAFIVPASGRRLEADVRAWLAERLPAVMIPARCEVIARMPLLPGGKVDASALRALLATPAAPDPDPAQHSASPLVAEVASVWAKVLRLESVPTDVDFVALGGDSLALIGLVLEVEALYRRQLTVDQLDGSFTVERLATLLDEGRLAPIGDSAVFQAQALGERAPIFFAHAIGRHTDYIVPLAAHLGVARPVYGLRPPEDLERNRSLPAMAAGYVEAVIARQPDGPIVVGGFSLGGLIAYEVACRLQDAGREVAMVVTIDTGCPLWRPSWREAPAILGRSLANLPGALHFHLRTFSPAKLRLRSGRLARRLLGRPARADDVLDVRYYSPDDLRYVDAHLAARDSYRPEPRRLPMAVFNARVQGLRRLAPDPSRGWSRVGDVRRVAQLPGAHRDLVAWVNLPRLAAELNAVLDEAGV